MRRSRRATGIQVALSTASVFPERVPDAFAAAARLGYDGIEIMVTTDPVSQDAAVLARLSDYHGVPVVAVHAPNLLITQRVWGLDAWGKLVRSQEMAQQLGARVVVVHPPFRWQREYAREFEAGLTRMSQQTRRRVRGREPVPAASRRAPRSPPTRRTGTRSSWTARTPPWTSRTPPSPAPTCWRWPRCSAAAWRTCTWATAPSPACPTSTWCPAAAPSPAPSCSPSCAPPATPGPWCWRSTPRKAADPEQRLADLAESLEFARRHLAGVAVDGQSAGDSLAGTATAGNLT